jgi:hypothetical protein
VKYEQFTRQSSTASATAQHQHVSASTWCVGACTNTTVCIEASKKVSIIFTYSTSTSMHKISAVAKY